MGTITRFGLGLAVAMMCSSAQAAPGDVDDDGLPDAWEVKGTQVNGKVLPYYGVHRDHADVFVVVSRFEGVDEALVKAEMERVKSYYYFLPVHNPDGRDGIDLHYEVLPDAITVADQENDWWVNREKYFPASWQGIAHWMQMTPPNSGGQASYGDAGSTATRWASFTHEFGHQLGLSHTGGDDVAWCPLYTSLMNYAYTDGFAGLPTAVHYSDGTFAATRLDERALPELLPYSHSQLYFLTQWPYRLTLRANGSFTYVDWNHDGQFSKGTVRADVTYGGGTQLGTRSEVGAIYSAPSLFTSRGRLYVAYGERVATDMFSSTLQDLRIREINSDGSVGPSFAVVNYSLIGDPMAVDWQGLTHVFFATGNGVQKRVVDPATRQVSWSTAFPSPTGFVPSAVGPYAGNLFLLLYNPSTREMRYSWSTNGESWQKPLFLGTSTVPPSFTEDGRGRMVVTAAAASGTHPSLLALRYYRLGGSGLSLESVESGIGNELDVTDRVTVLYDSAGLTGAPGKLVLYGRWRSLAGEATQAFMLLQVGDTSFNGGWLLKWINDEWSLTKSAPGATFFNGDIAYGYRWQSSATHENQLTVSFRGSGIDLGTCGDHDDLTPLRTTGLRGSLDQARADHGIVPTVTHN